MKILGTMLIFLGAAGILGATPTAPEIDPSSAGTAVALLTGALLILKGGRKK
jgi:hypothetical protein